MVIRFIVTDSVSESGSSRPRIWDINCCVHLRQPILCTQCQAFALKDIVQQFLDIMGLICM